MDPNGNIAVFHRGNRVWGPDTFDNANRFDPSNGPIAQSTILLIDKGGSVVQEWGDNMFYLPHGLTIDQSGNYWITDVAMHQVFKFDARDIERHSAAAGQPLKPSMTLGEAFMPGNDEKRFCKPTAVAVHNNGDFFVSDGYCNSRIIKFNRDGERILHWGRHWGTGGEKKDAVDLDLSPTVWILPLIEISNSLYRTGLLAVTAAERVPRAARASARERARLHLRGRSRKRPDSLLLRRQWHVPQGIPASRGRHQDLQRRVRPREIISSQRTRSVHAEPGGGARLRARHSFRQIAVDVRARRGHGQSARYLRDGGRRRDLRGGVEQSQNLQISTRHAYRKNFSILEIDPNDLTYLFSLFRRNERFHATFRGISDHRSPSTDDPGAP